MTNLFGGGTIPNQAVVTPLGDPIKVALIGDSMSAQNTILGASVIDILERRLNMGGVYTKIFPCNRDGHTFFRSMSGSHAYINGKTSVEAAIAYNPDVVIFMLGINDTVLASIVDNRSLANVKADADAAIAAIKTALPNAKIVYISQHPYDNGNFTFSTCKNKGTFPMIHKLNTAGILASYYTTEILDSVIDSVYQTGLDNWQQLDAYIKANPSINLSGTTEFWKVARLGGIGNDGAHMNPGGVLLTAGYVYKVLRGLSPTFTPLFTNNFAWWEDPDYLFSQLLTPSGDGYAYAGEVTSENQNIMSGGFLRPNTWHLPLPAVFASVTDVNSSGSSMYAWSIIGAKALTQVKVSVNGAAFSNIAGAITNSEGNISGIAAGSDVAGFSVGANTLRYAVDNISMTPTTVTFGVQTLPWVAPGTLNTWTAVTPATYGAVGSYLDKFGVVHLRGLVTGGASGSLLLTLPVGSRPLSTLFITTICNNNISYLQVDPSGTVYPFYTAAGNLSLGGIQFPVL
jgi:lysophospholipase L1-like esterase